MPVDRSAAQPFHVQLFDEIRAMIDAGEFPPGSRLPTEMELARRFEVHRLTVRQALAELARAGYVRARQGVGTFVAQRPGPFAFEMTPGDWAVEDERGVRAAAERGLAASHTLLTVEFVEAPPDVVEHLRAGTVLRMEALFRVENEPAVLSQYWAETAMTIEQVCEVTTERFDIPAIRAIVGADMYYGWRSFDAVAATRRDADLLEVPSGSPLLRRCGVNTDASGRPLLYLQRDAPSGRMRAVLRNRPLSDR